MVGKLKTKPFLLLNLRNFWPFTFGSEVSFHVISQSLTFNSFAVENVKFLPVRIRNINSGKNHHTNLNSRKKDWEIKIYEIYECDVMPFNIDCNF